MKTLAKLILFLSLSTVLFPQTKYWYQIPLPDEITSIDYISKDWDNNLWITNYSVIAVLNHYTNQWSIYDKTNLPLLNNSVSLVKYNPLDSILWVDTGSTLLAYKNPNWSTLKNATPTHEFSFGSTINCIAFDKLGNKWIGTTNGLIKLSKDMTIKTYDTSNTDMRSQDILAIGIDNKNNIWFTNLGSDSFATSSVPGQLIKFDNTNFSYLNVPSGSAASIAISSKDSVWIGLLPHFVFVQIVRGGIAKLKEDGSFIYFGWQKLFNTRVQDIQFDASDKLYIAFLLEYWGFHDELTSSGGLSYYNNGNFFHFDSTNSPLHYTPYFEVNALFIDSLNNVYVGIKVFGPIVTQLLYIYNSNGLTSIKDNNTIFNSFQLSPNYPNPFNPTTTISYQLPKAGLIELKVYDILGRVISTLVNKYENAGSHTVQFNGNNLPSGVYLYKIKAGEYSASRKMILLK